MQKMNLESLARAIHADNIAAANKFNGSINMTGDPKDDDPSFDDLPEQWKLIRREQARLMLERIMR